MTRRVVSAFGVAVTGAVLIFAIRFLMIPRDCSDGVSDLYWFYWMCYWQP